MSTRPCDLRIPRVRLAAIVCFLAAIVPAVLWAADPTPPISAAALKELVKQCSSDDFDQRDAARKKILGLGVESRDVLTAELAAQKGADGAVEARESIEAVLHNLRVAETKQAFKLLYDKYTADIEKMKTEIEDAAQENQRQFDLHQEKRADWAEKVEKLEKQIAANPKAKDSIEEDLIEYKGAIENGDKATQKRFDAMIARKTELIQQIGALQKLAVDLKHLTSAEDFTEELLAQLTDWKGADWKLSYVPMKLRLKALIRCEFINTPLEEALAFLVSYSGMNIRSEDMLNPNVTLNASVGLSMKEVLDSICKQEDAHLVIDEELGLIKIRPNAK
jgi:hypothetical protein